MALPDRQQTLTFELSSASKKPDAHASGFFYGKAFTKIAVITQ